MKKTLRKLLSILLIICLTFQMTGNIPQVRAAGIPTYYGWGAPGVENIDLGCRVYAVAMLLTAFGITSATPTNIKKNLENDQNGSYGMYFPIITKYYGVTISEMPLSGNNVIAKNNYIKNVLTSHPEGIIISSPNPSHAIYAFLYNGSVRYHDPYEVSKKNVDYNNLAKDYKTGHQYTLNDFNKIQYISNGTPPPPVTPSFTFENHGTGGSRGWVTETNASVYTVVHTNITSGLKCGLRIGTSSDNLSLAAKEEDMSSAGYNQISNNGYVEIWYDLNSELNCYLNPITTYYYQFYMKWNGTEYADAIHSFTTKGTDTQQPTISNVTVTDLTKDGYTVTCTVNDNVGVTSVKFPTWIEGTTNAVWYDGTINGNTATFRVLASNFSNESVTLRTDIYAYDAAGNNASYKNIPPQVVDRNAPSISDVKITDLNTDGYTVTCTVNDNVGVTSVKFPTWIEGTTNAVWHDGTINGNTATFRVLASNFSNESVTLQTHIYAYDAMGNNVSYKNIAPQLVDRNAPNISDVKITDLNKDGYTVTCTVNDNVGITSVKFPTWIEGTTNAIWYDGTINGNTATVRVLASDFSNESVTLQTHIYAYDAMDNSVSYKNIPPQFVDRNTESDPETDAELYNLSFATLTCDNTCLRVKKNNAAQTPKNIKVVYNGKTLKKNTDYTISYKKGGQIVTKPTTVGEYTMIVTGKGKYTGTKSITITVTNKKLLSSVTVKVNKLTYTGKPIISGVIKSVKNGKTKLTEGTDYTVTYENNVNSGKGTVILKAVEDSEYAGEKRISFNITGIKMSKVKVTGIEAKDFNGKGDVKQDLSKIKLAYKTKILVKGTDYDVSYENNDKAGTARIVFTGKGAYNGTLKKTFKIKKVNLINVQMDNSDITVPLEKGGAKPDVNLTYNGVKLVKGVDYTLSYSNNKSANGKKTPTIKIKGKGNYTGNLKKIFTIVEKN